MVVRPLKEILTTLDARGTLRGLPFMPEMMSFCGQRFSVWRRVEKTCVEGDRMRRMEGVVFVVSFGMKRGSARQTQPLSKTRRKAEQRSPSSPTPQRSAHPAIFANRRNCSARPSRFQRWTCASTGATGDAEPTHLKSFSGCCCFRSGYDSGFLPKEGPRFSFVAPRGKPRLNL